MKLKFLGTGTSQLLPKRGCHCPQCNGARANTRDSRRVASVLIETGDAYALIGPTAEALAEVSELTPDIVLTTIFDKTYCDWTALKGAGMELDEIDPLGGTIERGQLSIESFPLSYSAHDPAVGFRIGTAVYCPCLMDIEPSYLDGVTLYIGDGTSLFSDLSYGHASVKRQLGILKEAGVPRAVFTHVGHERFSHDDFEARLKTLAGDMDVSLAYDGMEIEIGEVSEMPYGANDIPTAVKNQSPAVIALFRRVFNSEYAKQKRSGKDDETADKNARQAAWAAVKNAGLDLKKESVVVTDAASLLKYLSEDTRRLVHTELEDQGLTVEALVENTDKLKIVGRKKNPGGGWIYSCKKDGKPFGNVVLEESHQIGDEIAVK